MCSGNLDRLIVGCSNCGGTYYSQLYVGSDDVFFNGTYEECPHCLHTNKGPSGTIGELKANQSEPRQPRVLNYVQAKPYFYYKPKELIFSLKTSELRDTVASFNSNVGRLHAMIELPVNVAWLSRLLEQLKRKALSELFGDEDHATTEQEQDQFHMKFSDLWRKWFAANAGEPRIEFVDRHGEQTIENLTGAPIWLALEANLSTQTTGMWTTFEALAGDLWEAALNAHPNGLAELKGKAPKGNKKARRAVAAPDQEKPSLKQSEGWLRMRSLQVYKYDLSKHMGTALKYRYNFSVLESIREAYLNAFHKNYQRICDAITHPSLDALSAVRNVIVHKAGIADAEFINDVRAFPVLAAIQINQRIPIDGPLIELLLRPVLDQCVALIKAVDAWIAGQPDRQEEDVP